MKKIAPLIIFALALLLLQNASRLRQLLDPISNEQLSSSDVLIYSTSWCPYCAKTRRFLHNANISFIEYDIEKSTRHYQQYEAYGGNGVPLIIIGPTIVQGYDPTAIREAVEALSESRTAVATSSDKD